MSARPIRGLNCDARSLDQACADLGLDPADYRAARGEASPMAGSLVVPRDCMSRRNRPAASPRIVVTHQFPPIPDRRFDWLAHWDGQEESRRYGWGRTRDEALTDLLENYPWENDT